MKADKTPVRTAFASDWAAILFSACLLFSLTLPLVLAYSGAVSKRAIFTAIPAEGGDYQYMYKQIFEDRSDIDVLFLGGCQMWCGGTQMSLIQKKLSDSCGSHKTVLALAHPWRGEDADYLLLRDLLSKRRVRFVVLQDPSMDQYWSNWPEKMSEFWFSTDEMKALSGLPLAQQVSMYAQGVLGAPRQVLSLLRRNKLGQLRNSCAEYCGTVELHVGWHDSPFKEFNPAPLTVPIEQLFYASNPNAFTICNEPPPQYQMHYLKLITDLLKERQIPYLFLHVPELAESEYDKVPIRMCWPNLFDKQSDILGVPKRRLFSGMTKEQINLLYWDDFHLNVNGGKYFSTVIAPGVISAYKKSVPSQ